MTDQEFQDILSRIRDQMGLTDDETLYNYLESIDEPEKSQLIAAVSEEFGIEEEAFRKKLAFFLLVRAKPWANESDVP